MSKKKPPKPADKHKSGFMVRLPEELREVLEAVKVKHGQPYTVATQRAILAYAREMGIELLSGK